MAEPVTFPWIPVLLVLTAIVASVAGLVSVFRFPRQGAMVIATAITAFAFSQLFREAWADGRKWGVRVLLLGAAFLLAYELWYMFSLILGN